MVLPEVIALGRADPPPMPPRLRPRTLKASLLCMMLYGALSVSGTAAANEVPSASRAAAQVEPQPPVLPEGAPPTTFPVNAPPAETRPAPSPAAGPASPAVPAIPVKPPSPASPASPASSAIPASPALIARPASAASGAITSTESARDGLTAAALTDGGGEPAMLLIVPSASTPFAAAADAVRQGFLSAHKADGSTRRVQVLEVDETPAQVTAALKSARERGVRVVVGPLTRGAVNALDNGSGRLVPMVTLNVPDWEATAPSTLLAFGIAVESEARRLVTAAIADPNVQRAGLSTAAQRKWLVVGGRAAWAGRAMAAFRQALSDAGEQAIAIEPGFDSDALQRFSTQVKNVSFDAVFMALDAREAALIRPRLARDVPLYATSQVNAGEALMRTVAQELAGIRFVDMPWVLEPDHPAVMVYPRLPLTAGVAVTPELERLYAMGIDAYRLAAEWAAGRTRFELDGVTGTLRVDRDRGARVERLPSFAVIRGGRVLREDPAR